MELGILRSFQWVQLVVYKAKWVEWEAVADEMALDELALNEHY